MISIACNLVNEDVELVEKIKEKLVIKLLGWEVNILNSNNAKMLPRLRKLMTCIENRRLRRHYSVQVNGAIEV